MKTHKGILRASFTFVLLFFVFVQSVYANHREMVLGASTTTETPAIPPTVEGPGFLLPDSPLYFLDDLKQNVRLAFAFSPEAKAQVHAQIAGERLAELRFMLAKNNTKGIQTDLEGISENLMQAADQLAKAQLRGNNVTTVAKEINTTIKDKQQSLDLLQNQTSGEMQARVEVVSKALLESKIKVEDSLPQQDLAKEIENDLNRAIERGLEDASDSALRIETYLAELNRQASDSANQSLKNREELLKKAIASKNEELKKHQEKMLDNEQKKRDAIYKLHAEEAARMKEIVKKAQEAAKSVRQTQKTVNTINSIPPEYFNTYYASHSSIQTSSGSSSAIGGSSVIR